MKIVLHSIQDLKDLLALVAPVHRERVGDISISTTLGDAPLPTWSRAFAVSGDDTCYDENPIREVSDVTGPDPDAAAALADPNLPRNPLATDKREPEAKPANGPEVDSRGIPWNEQVHSKTRGRNSDGTWRALRGVDKDLLAAVEAELLAVVPKPEPATPESGDPVTTERHPLPTSEPTGHQPPGLDGLADRAAAAAGDAPDGVIAVLDAGKKFIEAHGVATYNAVKGAVVGDTPTQKLQPAERRLLCAALSLYDPATP